MKRQLDKFTLTALFDAEIVVIGEVPWIAGGRSIQLDYDDIEPFCDNKITWIAKKEGVTVKDFEQWLEAGGDPICVGYLNSGKPCSRKVFQVRGLPVREWVEFEGYCRKHGGET
ncbi:MAG: hypothetical protein COB39_00310 [Marinosulfonomonas sp.]|nr:MAG: hypothetical protein COB39_00310 [Marinosulfonomonas sp.]